ICRPLAGCALLSRASSGASRGQTQAHRTLRACSQDNPAACCISRATKHAQRQGGNRLVCGLGNSSVPYVPTTGGVAIATCGSSTTSRAVYPTSIMPAKFWEPTSGGSCCDG